MGILDKPVSDAHNPGSGACRARGDMDAPLDIPRSQQPGQAERFDINLGRRCSQRCLFCVESAEPSAEKRWLDLDIAKEEVRAHAGPNTFALGLLGGEPTLYPPLIELIEHARSLGYRDITINTNGFGLAKPDFAARAVAAGLNRVCFSIHSHEEALEDELSGMKGSYARKLRAIENLRALQGRFPLVLSLNAVVNARTYAHLDDYLRFFRDRGFDDIRLNVIRPEGRAVEHPELVPTYRAIMPMLMKLVELNERELHLHLTFGEIPYCAYPAAFFANERLRRTYIGEYIDYYTQIGVFLHPDLTRRDAKHLPAEINPQARNVKVWQDVKREELKARTAACAACAWVGICGGVWKGYLALYGEDGFMPLSQAGERLPLPPIPEETTHDDARVLADDAPDVSPGGLRRAFRLLLRRLGFGQR